MKNFFLTIVLITFTNIIWGQLEVRVLDVGAGLCTIIKLPNGKYILYDAGSARESVTKKNFAEIIPINSEIELFIISHTDADHLNVAAFILENYKIKCLIHTGYSKAKANLELKHKVVKNADAYMKFEQALVKEQGMELHNLFADQKDIEKPLKWDFGDVKVSLLCGFSKPRAEWQISEISIALNAVSIVAKVEYKSKSILFCGDALGRMIGDPIESIKMTEKYLVEKYSNEMLHSEVIIAPHHGADNGSSVDFIQKVKPDYVIFSSGYGNAKKDYNHPTKQAVERYIKYCNVALANIFRTDRGDGWNISSEYNNATTGTEAVEWNGQSIKNCEDVAGDDDVIIKITSLGIISVKYAQEDPYK